MDSEDVLVTMQNDLKRALSRPASDRRWVMLIDTRKCVGCHACTAGCMAENALPPGVIYRPVFESESGTYPDVRRTFVPRPCQHCDEPPCVPVCPAEGKATWKSTTGVSAGLVMIDPAQCIGCGNCVSACPYQARSLDEGQYHAANAPSVPDLEKRPTEEYGVLRRRVDSQLPIGTARKCHFCLHRMQTGRLPMCVTTCIGRATYFGDEKDPASLVAIVKKASKITTMRSVEDATPITGHATFGKSPTAPRVYYILK